MVTFLLSWVFWVCLVFGILGLLGGVREQRALKRSVGLREPMVEDREQEIDRKLWDLLKDEDPAWLVAMGIEAPKHPRAGSAIGHLQAGSTVADRISAGAVVSVRLVSR